MHDIDKYRGALSGRKYFEVKFMGCGCGGGHMKKLSEKEKEFCCQSEEAEED